MSSLLLRTSELTADTTSRAYWFRSGRQRMVKLVLWNQDATNAVAVRVITEMAPGYYGGTSAAATSFTDPSGWFIPGEAIGGTLWHDFNGPAETRLLTIDSNTATQVVDAGGWNNGTPAAGSSYALDFNASELAIVGVLKAPPKTATHNYKNIVELDMTSLSPRATNPNNALQAMSAYWFQIKAYAGTAVIRLQCWMEQDGVSIAMT